MPVNQNITAPITPAQAKKILEDQGKANELLSLYQHRNCFETISNLLVKVENEFMSAHSPTLTSTDRATIVAFIQENLNAIIDTKLFMEAFGIPLFSDLAAIDYKSQVEKIRACTPQAKYLDALAAIKEFLETIHLNNGAVVTQLKLITLRNQNRKQVTGSGNALLSSLKTLSENINCNIEALKINTDALYKKIYSREIIELAKELSCVATVLEAHSDTPVDNSHPLKKLCIDTLAWTSKLILAYTAKPIPAVEPKLVLPIVPTSTTAPLLLSKEALATTQSSQPLTTMAPVTNPESKPALLSRIKSRL